MIPTLPQTLVMLALARGDQPAWISPPVRVNLVKRRWIAQTGTRPAKSGREIPTWGVTPDGRAALAASPHRDVAERRLELGLQRSPWLP